MYITCICEQYSLGWNVNSPVKLGFLYENMIVTCNICLFRDVLKSLELVLITCWEKADLLALVCDV